MDQIDLFSFSTYVQEEHREELELAAFTSTVTQLFGPEQARLAEKDWLDELDLIDSPPVFAERNLRAVTVAASFRLAAESDLKLLPTNLKPVRQA